MRGLTLTVDLSTKDDDVPKLSQYFQETESHYYNKPHIALCAEIHKYQQLFVFGLKLINLVLNKLNFIKLILVRSEFKMK